MASVPLLKILNVSKIRQMVFQNRHGRRWFYTVARFGLCTNLVAGTPKDGRGISQKQVLEQNLSSTDVHGRTSVERYRDVRFLTVYFKRLTERLNTASEKSSTYQNCYGWGRIVFSKLSVNFDFNPLSSVLKNGNPINTYELLRSITICSVP